MVTVRFLLSGLFLLFLLFGLQAPAQEISVLREGGVQSLSLSDLARNLGQLPTAAAGTVTLRLEPGVLTLFEDSREALWFPRGAEGPVEVEFAVTTRYSDGDWWVSTDLVGLLGGRISGRVLTLPGHARLLLAADPAGSGDAAGEVLELAGNVSALRLRSGTSSVLLVDLGLLGLVHPGQQQQIDAFLAQLEGERPLYFVVSSLTDAAWEPEFSFRQEGLEFDALHPWHVVLLEGDGQFGAPGQPVSGVILLPAAANLRIPLEVHWQGATGRLAFRR
jgi:hypothetical protein